MMTIAPPTDPTLIVKDLVVDISTTDVSTTDSSTNTSSVSLTITDKSDTSIDASILVPHIQAVDEDIGTTTTVPSYCNTKATAGDRTSFTMDDPLFVSTKSLESYSDLQRIGTCNVVVDVSPKRKLFGVVPFTPTIRCGSFACASSEYECTDNFLEDEEDDDHSEENLSDIDYVSPGSESTPTISKKETQDVRRYKLVVFLALCIAAVFFAVFTTSFVRNNERKQFEEAFYSNSNIIFEAIGNSIDNTLIPLDTLAVTIVSFSKAHNDTWPFITLPDFGLRMSKILPQTGGVVVNFLPIVQPEKRLHWEQYARFNNRWVNESYHVQEHWDKYYGYIGYDWQANDIIHGDLGDIPSNVSRPMAPQWQIFPVSTQYFAPYNWDWLSQLHPEYLYTAMDHKACVINAPIMIARPDDLAAQKESEGWIDYFSDFISPDDEPFEPMMDFTYPIIDDLSEVNLQESVDSQNQVVVGLFAMTAYFREIIRNVLPPGSNGMIIVVDNDCAKTFTYQIDGPNVTYLGIYDQHETKYDDLVTTSILSELYEFQFRHSTYSGVPLDKEFCPYILRLYPSTTMENNYRSDKAIIFVFVTIMSFVVLAVLFRCYDGKVQIRQTQVLSLAIRSTNLVSSLFPTSVHDQLYDSHPNEKGGLDQNCPDKNEVVNVNPIATLYPETTVMFADIKGFTSWSSSREPSQVFRLLEAIYSAFDIIADKYNVFKVETIGDTYVAVAGLPNPMKFHAVIMVKFANRCIEKMVEVTRSLEEALGSDTSNLSIRVGLNSGPTTAGVLRGAKSRFQLFGDTVNTASRMESNGESNRIHISEATAHILRQFGKNHWITPRVEKVIVKGKGVMQTYWCNPSTRRLRNGSQSGTGRSHTDSDGNVLPNHKSCNDTYL